MPHAIIHGNNCSRHEVDFENAETAVKVSENEQNLELMAEVLKEEYPWQKKGFALISLLHFSSEKTVADLASKHFTTIKVVW